MKFYKFIFFSTRYPEPNINIEAMMQLKTIMAANSKKIWDDGCVTVRFALISVTIVSILNILPTNSAKLL